MRTVMHNYSSDKFVTVKEIASSLNRPRKDSILWIKKKMNWIRQNFPGWTGIPAKEIRRVEKADIMKEFYMHPTSIADENVWIGAGTKIWHFSHIQSGARIGENCSLGQNVNISNNVKLGNCVKVQNNVSVYEGVELEDFVFCGPSAVFTNDLTPRAGYPKKHKYKKTLIKHDASLGANCTIVCGHTVGEFAMIAAGAVVTKDVKPHALMAGIPARQAGWVCECGLVLDEGLRCAGCGKEYRLKNGALIPGGGIS